MEYENGQKMVEGYLRKPRDSESAEPLIDNGIKVGHWTAWHRNGQKSAEGVYKSGSAEGHWVGWYKNGQKRMDGGLKDGEEEGRWTFWNENGSVDTERSGIYKAGEKIAPLPKK